MTLPHISLAIATALLLASGGSYCLWVTLKYERPLEEAPWLTIAVWWMGQCLAWAILATLAGGLFGIAARAAWVMGGGE